MIWLTIFFRVHRFFTLNFYLGCNLGQVSVAVNIIAENMLTQVDSDGMRITLMEAIVVHRRDNEKAL